MRAHLVQFDIAWEDPDENFDRVDRLLTHNRVSRGDLVLLPEMFAVGFSLNTQVTADRGPTLAYLARLADDTGAIVQGGRAVQPCDCDKATNVMSVLDGSGSSGEPVRQVAEYAKVHPFSFGREPESFKGGDEIVTYPWGPEKGPVTVAPSVCYDLRFPELFRLQMLKGAECFALGACWPEARQEHWRALAIARAIENQAFMLACNRTGSDPHLTYAGGSIAVGPTGEVLGELGPEPGVLSVDIDPEQVRQWRATFGAWKDARLIGREP
ncbi:MAG: omega-amidase [Phycisphaerales bacterium]